jgi:hypothetical protein
MTETMATHIRIPGKNGNTSAQLENGKQPTAAEREMPCPVCGHPMPDLKGGKATICSVCGFKDSCCY